MIIEPQDEFIARRRVDWDALDALLHDGRARRRSEGLAISRLAALYRSLCSDLMRARAAGYDHALIAHLDGLAARGHNTLYRAPPMEPRVIVALLQRGFPRALRRHGRLFALAAALFLLPGALGFVGALQSPAYSAAVLPEAVSRQMLESYSRPAAGREAVASTAMAGFYIYNNVGIAFRCFATGVLLGLGSLFFLVYNGMTIGTVFGVVFRAGHGANIVTFCCGHAPLELNAIVIAGTAGMVMGYALVETHGMTRLSSVRAVAGDLTALILGAAAMLGLAALVEGYWSPSAVPAPVKWAASLGLSVAVAVWLAVGGRAISRQRA